MPHFGPKVVGDDTFRRMKAHEDATGNNHFGSRVVGPPPVAPPVEGRSVREMLAEVKAGGNLAQLADEELNRDGGARRSVVRAMMAEGGKRGVSPEFLERLSKAIAGEAESDDE